jgi:uncharacterized damage-inducible protein DinB
MAPMKTPRQAECASTSEIEHVLTLLSGTPRDIARIVKGLSERQLQRQPHTDAWSAQQVVAHLRACADAYGHWITRMLAEDHPTIRYVSPRGWIRKTDYLQHNFSETLDGFSKERSRLLAVLTTLKPGEWARGATFTGTVSGRNGTVLSYAARMANHEVGHLDQIRRTVRP